MNFMHNTFGGNPFGNFMALVQKFQQFASNPFGSLMGLTGVEIPQNLSNDPQGMVQHLRQSGQMDQNQFNWFSQLAGQFSNFLKRGR